jgi:predicted RNase H-like HicB family nuclease
MNARYVLSDYIEQAIARAVYDKLDDGTFAGRIPMCKGVVAFAGTLRECEQELRSVLEDWIILGFNRNRLAPVLP